MYINDLFTGSNELPKPLPKEKLLELIEKVKQGDEEAKNKIIEHNIRLVLYEVTHRFKYVNYDKRDLVSLGNIGLMKAINTFDTSKNVEFTTYATRCIDNEILMFLRKIKKDQNVDSLEKPLSYDKNGNELKVEDTVYDDTDIVEDYEKNEIYKIIRRMVEGLPERDRKIITLHFGFEEDKIYTQKEIADILFVSQSYISRLVKKIVREIGIQLEIEGLIELTEAPARVYKRAPKKVKQEFKKSDESKIIIKTAAEEKEPVKEIIIETTKEKEVEAIKEETTEIEKANTESEENKPKKKNRKSLKTIYNYLKEYSREEIDAMLSKLSDEELTLIRLRYGEDLDNPVTAETWGKNENVKFYGLLVPKMRRVLSNPEGKRKKYTRRVKNTQPTTLSNEETLQNSSVEGQDNLTGNALEDEGNLTGNALVDEGNLSGNALEDEGNLSGNALVDEGNLTGNALDETSEDETLRNALEQVIEEEQGNLFGNALEDEGNLTGNALDEDDDEDEVIKPEIIPQNDENAIVHQENTELSKEDYEKILHLMKTPSFEEMLRTLTAKEAVIICLKLGYVDGKYFTTESIANFLGIEKSEVVEITKKVLLLYRESINQFIDKAIEEAGESTTTPATGPTLVYKKDEE